MAFDKRKIIMKALITSQVSFCTLVWMYHNKRLCQETNTFYQKALRFPYGEKASSCNDMLEKDNSASNPS